MKTSALASGSSGNCFFVESGNCSFLVDAGVSCKQIEQRMDKIGKDVSYLKGIFVTHEHSDHIRGVDVLARKYSVPVFVTKGCYENCSLVSDDSLVNFIDKDKVMKLDNVKVLPFSKNHDASDPVSYSVASGNKKVSFMTDIGVACNNVVKHVKDSNVLFMEANHDIEMLSNGRYPAYLKKRILSDNGHLSNYAAALCILEHATPKLKHIVLSHLSENNNTEEIALKTIKSLISNRKDLDLKIHLSSKHEPTELISI
jgi:phosphoribosyl 1,2-cyclic phosphodiesterase